MDGKKIRVDFSITKRAHTPTPGMYMGRPSGGHTSYGGGRDRGPPRDHYRDRYRWEHNSLFTFHTLNPCNVSLCPGIWLLFICYVDKVLSSGDPRAPTTDAGLPRPDTERGPDTGPGPGATLPVSIVTDMSSPCPNKTPSPTISLKENRRAKGLRVLNMHIWYKG